MRHLRPFLVLLALAGAGLTSCGNDPTVEADDAPDATPTTATSTAGGGDEPGSTPSTAASGAPGAPFSTDRVVGDGGGRGLLADVEARSEGTVDRVTFTFEGPLPGYRIEYVERPIVQDGSGEEITVDGEAVLSVHFEPASGFDLSGEGRQVYQGPNDLDLATRVVLDVVRVSDFEANLQWAIGVDTKARFRVRTADGPARVIVEVEIPPAG